MSRFLDLKRGGGVKGNVTFWINGITIVKGWMTAFGLKELVFDEDLNEKSCRSNNIWNCPITHHKLCPFGYMTIDSNFFWWTLSMVNVFFLWSTSHVGKWRGKNNWWGKKINTWLLTHKDSNGDCFVSKLKNLCMMNQL
jgi:hypothetical protein